MKVKRGIQKDKKTRTERKKDKENREKDRRICTERQTDKYRETNEQTDTDIFLHRYFVNTKGMFLFCKRTPNQGSL